MLNVEKVETASKESTSDLAAADRASSSDESSTENIEHMEPPDGGAQVRSKQSGTPRSRPGVLIKRMYLFWRHPYIHILQIENRCFRPWQSPVDTYYTTHLASSVNSTLRTPNTVR